MAKTSKQLGSITFTDPVLTKQSFKDECDINHIVSRFQTTGNLPFNNMSDPQYGFAPEIDFKTALDLTKSLQTEFSNLSDEKKDFFEHDFRNYGEFLNEYAESPESFYESEAAKPDTDVQQNDERPNLSDTEPQ